MINIGINGLGRIGRVLLRQILTSNNLKVIAINDINPDANNIAYLIKYDSSYGRLKASVSVKKNYIHVNKDKIKLFNKVGIDEVDWKKSKVDFLIDSSGVKKNLILSRKLKDKVKNIIVTNSPGSKYVDKTMIYGVNDDNFEKSKDFDGQEKGIWKAKSWESYRTIVSEMFNKVGSEFDPVIYLHSK